MTHAAVVTTETPDLQALFDQDWTSGKYRRPKCSKADFYAGWLLAYEHFKTVVPVEKLQVVESQAPAKARKSTKQPRQPQADGIKEQFSVPCEAKDCKHLTAKFNHGYWKVEQQERADHNRLVTYYQGGLPLKHEAPKGPSPMHGTNWSQAIPDSLLRKLCVKAGRPEIAP